MTAAALITLLALSFLCAAIPALLFIANLRAYAIPASPDPDQTIPAVSILIPARNEANAIGAAVRAALSTTAIDFEIIVMDDSSTDSTAVIVQQLASEDPRVRLEQAPPLPPEWNGKQHACWSLAQTARNPLLCFVDADVRLAPKCIARMASQLQRGQSSLISGFPRQITVTTLEWLLLPLIHFVLLGFLPVARMRATTDPRFAAGCGQFMLVRAQDYLVCGGHSNIKQTMHDGLRLPRLFREHGFRTDLADITPFATCRMYTNASEVWSGLAKNATEGIADPKRIVPITLVLLLGQVVPFGLAYYIASNVFLAASLDNDGFSILYGVIAVAATCILCAPVWLPRILAVRRFRQDWRSALLHPIGILLLLLIQWYALIRKLRRSPISWRDRAYTPTP